MDYRDPPPTPHNIKWTSFAPPGWTNFAPPLTPTERLGATVEHDGEPNASGIASVFPVVELGARLSMTHLDGTGDENLVVNTTAFPHAFARQPRFRPPQHGSWAVHRSCLGWAAPCPSGACGEFERPSRSAKDQVAAETARRTCRASDWRPDKRPRTRRSAECGYAPSLFCQWRSKKGPPRRCKKGPLGGCGLVPVVHGRAPRTTRRALNRLTRRRAREGPVGPRGQAWAGWSVQLAVGV